MKCIDCGNTVNLAKGILVRTGCASFSAAYWCNVCRRLHFGDGKGVFGRGNPPAKVYYLGGELVRKD